MTKVLIAASLGVILVFIFILWIVKLFSTSITPSPIAITQTLTPAPTLEKVDVKASFTIITGNITRSFKAEKYHNLSPDVYIQNPDPTIVYVIKPGVKWDDFFKTLPMKLTRDCLTTGDGETYCNGKDGSLKFYLNDVENPDLLDKEIKDGDKALIKFIHG